MDHDILIRRGLVLDGSGAASRRADIGIRNGRVASVGSDLSATGTKTIDARGLVVAPGFIDIKTHSDFTLPINPKAESKVRQGVTTEIIGHCGYSVAPALPGKVELLRDYLSPSAPWLPFKAMSFSDYLDTFPATAVNVGMLVGHNTLRLMVMGMDDRPASRPERDAMAVLLDQALAAGALGLSSGLFTAPGCHAQPDEIVALCRRVERCNGGYFTHLRDEADGVLPAIAEAIEVAEECRLHVQIVHFKCSGSNNWGMAKAALNGLAQAKARGLSVDCDFYPYTAGSNPLKNLLPPWVQAGGVDAMRNRLRLPEMRERVRSEIERKGLNNWGRIPSWDAVQISVSPKLPHYAGRSVASLAAERGADPMDTVLDYLIDDAATRVLVSSISEDDVRELIRSPAALVGSDGNAVATEGVVSQGRPHPRFYGTFPRIISRYVRELHLLTLEQAVHKMTGATAQALKLADRGFLREGYRADVTIFDPEDFCDRATYADPHQYPSGERTTVLVNGVLVVENAVHTGALPGKVLRRDGSGRVH